MTQAECEVVALLIASVLSPVLIELLKNIPLLAKYKATTTFVVSLLIALIVVLASEPVGGIIEEPLQLLGKIAVVFMVSTAVYRALIKPRRTNSNA